MTKKDCPSYPDMKEECLNFVMVLYRKHYHEYKGEEALLRFILNMAKQDFKYKKAVPNTTRTLRRWITGCIGS